MLKCLPLFDQALDAKAPAVLTFMVSLSRAYDFLGQSDNAQDLLQTALDGRAEILGSDHPFTEEAKAELHQLRFRQESGKYQLLGASINQSDRLTGLSLDNW